MDPDLITDVVAIDGPAGAGKSTAARRLAKLLGFAFLDTGAMYRAATWRALDRGVDPNDHGALARSTRLMDLDMRESDGKQTVLVDGRDVTEAIRSPEVTREIYRLDAIPDVRAHLVELQRQVATLRPTVAEGRDMGTVVFPKAKCKFYIEALLDERARRRYEELRSKGIQVDFQALRDEIESRDHRAMTRTISPLRAAEDAVRIDTTHMTLDRVVDEMAALARSVF
jgi:cytidylate kinase